MKNILIMCLLMVSSFSFADTTAIEEFLYEGVDSSYEIRLSTEKTKTEYRNVRVPSTCYRTEYRNICEPRPPRCTVVCDRNGNCRQRCAPGGTVCRNVPVSIPYPCTRTERRPVQVHDYYVETNIQFEFAKEGNVFDEVREAFKVSVTGEDSSLSVKSSKNYFIILDKRLRSESRSGDVKYVDLVYKIKLVSAVAAKNVLSDGIQDVKLRNGVLNFSLGAGFNLDQFTQKIRIYRNRRFMTDPLLLTKYLETNEIDVQTINQKSHVVVDLNNLGIRLPNNMRVVLDTEFKLEEEKLLNRNQIKTSAYANWVFR
ncbi:MAG: hypothetical protein QF441_04535 [Bacteriovoracaceae bacterium]|nr:hypothetical protein [Halobacteriovoraceae bacterium]MDP7319848.1 hypothetical protein [Bacteriovoracaceae bacterium]